MSRLYWSNLPEAKSPRGGTKDLMQFVHDRGFADAGISGDQHEFRRALGHDAIKRGKQGRDLARPPV